MQIVYERCAGLDVHKRTVVVCAITPDAKDRRCKERRTFSTMTPDLLRLRDWLAGLGVTQVAMESTGSFWKPIFNILEDDLEVLVVNAQHLKAVPRPGKRTSKMPSGLPTCSNMGCCDPALSLRLGSANFAS